MNHLMGKSDGFPLGSTIQAQTKGFWIWSGDFPGNKAYAMILIDVEGLGDPEEGDRSYDSKLFTLALLSSSLFIYNIMGTISADSLHELSLATKVVDEIIEKTTTGEITFTGKQFPHLVLTIRDQCLELKADGKQLTPNEYLDHCLKEKIVPSKCSIEERKKMDDNNNVRKAICSCFPRERRNCHVFPKPADDEQMKNLEKLQESELKPKFKEATEKFVDIIKSNAKPIQFNGSVLNGHSFAVMFEALMKSVNSLNIKIRPTFDSVVHESIHRANADAIKTIEEMFQEAELPMASSKLEELIEKVSEKVTNDFTASCIGIKSDPEILNDLKERLKKECEKLRKKNLDASASKCQQLLKESFSSILFEEWAPEKLDKYFVKGGFAQLTEDLEKMKQNYENKCCLNDGLQLSQCDDAFANFEKKEVALKSIP